MQTQHTPTRHTRAWNSVMKGELVRQRDIIGVISKFYSQAFCRHFLAATAAGESDIFDACPPELPPGEGDDVFAIPDQPDGDLYGRTIRALKTLFDNAEEHQSRAAANILACGAFLYWHVGQPREACMFLDRTFPHPTCPLETSYLGMEVRTACIMHTSPQWFTRYLHPDSERLV